MEKDLVELLILHTFAAEKKPNQSRRSISYGESDQRKTQKTTHLFPPPPLQTALGNTREKTAGKPSQGTRFPIA